MTPETGGRERTLATPLEQRRHARGGTADRGLVDLTMPMSERTIPVPGHPPPELEPLDGEREGMASTLMRLSVHTGTHVDAPSLVTGDQSIDQLPIERFWRPALCLDLTDAEPGEAIDLAALDASGFSPEGVGESILMLATGWTDRAWGSERLYTDHPFLAEDAARALAAARPTALGLDFAIDAGRPWPNHSILLGADVLLIENLMGLAALPPDGFDVIAFPLRLADESGAPARVVASLPL